MQICAGMIGSHLVGGDQGRGLFYFVSLHISLLVCGYILQILPTAPLIHGMRAYTERQQKNDR